MTNQRKVIIGFSLALIICFTIACSFALTSVHSLRAEPIWAAGGIGLLGLALVVLGRARESVSSDDDTRINLSAPLNCEEHPLRCFSRPGYWGCILLLTAVPVFFLIQQLSKPMIVAARTLPKPVIPETEVIPVPPSPPVVARSFPELYLGGLICNGARSTASVNGQSIRLGEKIEGVRVVAIERWGITVEMDGREKHIMMPR